MFAITTTYLLPTNTRPARIRVHRNGESPKRGMLFPWDHGLGQEANHRAAARAYLLKIGQATVGSRWHMGEAQEGVGFTFVREGSTTITFEEEGTYYMADLEDGKAKVRCVCVTKAAGRVRVDTGAEVSADVLLYENQIKALYAARDRWGCK